MKILSLLIRFSFVLLFFIVAWQTAAFFSRTTSAIPSPSPATTPVPVAGSTAADVPEISAKHVFILDRHSGTVLYQKAADEEIYPASTTKMMTAVIAYEHYPLDSTVTVDQSYPEGVDINLHPGEKMHISDLLYALLVPSANDAAEVLAADFPGGRSAFVAAMNEKAASLFLHHTRFLNPTGLDETGHYSSAADLARIADYLLGIPYLARIVSTENAVVASSDYSSYHPFSNVNQLLGKVSGVMGIKTGYTDLAGEALVTYIDRDDHQVIISLLGSSDRFGDTQKLIDWVYSSFTWLPHQ